ncbi:MAG: helix-hairpin-helix domain-containing protein [Wujia sp.]
MRSLKFLFCVLMCIAFFLGSCGRKAEIIEQSDISSNQEITTAASEQETTAISLDEDKDLWAVYVCGAVVEPGVYYLKPGAIKQEALDAAGGFDEGAACFYVNLAQEIADGERIYFPYEEELTGDMASLYGEGDSSRQDKGKININTADEALLMTLPGIGETRAKAIVTYREEHGAFERIEDICNVSGIKEATFNNIKEYIVVD